MPQPQISNETGGAEVEKQCEKSERHDGNNIHWIPFSCSEEITKHDHVQHQESDGDMLPQNVDPNCSHDMKINESEENVKGEVISSSLSVLAVPPTDLLSTESSTENSTTNVITSALDNNRPCQDNFEDVCDHKSDTELLNSSCNVTGIGEKDIGASNLYENLCEEASGVHTKESGEPRKDDCELHHETSMLLKLDSNDFQEEIGLDNVIQPLGDIHVPAECEVFILGESPHKDDNLLPITKACSDDFQDNTLLDTSCPSVVPSNFLTTGEHINNNQSSPQVNFETISTNDFQEEIGLDNVIQPLGDIHVPAECEVSISGESPHKDDNLLPITKACADDFQGNTLLDTSCPSVVPLNFLTTGEHINSNQSSSQVNSETISTNDFQKEIGLDNVIQPLGNIHVPAECEVFILSESPHKDGNLLPITKACSDDFQGNTLLDTSCPSVVPLNCLTTGEHINSNQSRPQVNSETISTNDFQEEIGLDNVIQPLGDIHVPAECEVSILGESPHKDDNLLPITKACSDDFQDNTLLDTSCPSVVPLNFLTKGEHINSNQSSTQVNSETISKSESPFTSSSIIVNDGHVSSLPNHAGDDNENLIEIVPMGNENCSDICNFEYPPIKMQECTNKIVDEVSLQLNSALSVYSEATLSNDTSPAFIAHISSSPNEKDLLFPVIKSPADCDIPCCTNVPQSTTCLSEVIATISGEDVQMSAEESNLENKDTSSLNSINDNVTEKEITSDCTELTDSVEDPIQIASLVNNSGIEGHYAQIVNSESSGIATSADTVNYVPGSVCSYLDSEKCILNNCNSDILSSSSNKETNLISFFNNVSEDVQFTPNNSYLESYRAVNKDPISTMANAIDDTALTIKPEEQDLHNNDLPVTPSEVSVDHSQSSVIKKDSVNTTTEIPETSDFSYKLQNIENSELKLYNGGNSPDINIPLSVCSDETVNFFCNEKQCDSPYVEVPNLDLPKDFEKNLYFPTTDVIEDLTEDKDNSVKEGFKNYDSSEIVNFFENKYLNEKTSGTLLVDKLSQDVQANANFCVDNNCFQPENENRTCIFNADEMHVNVSESRFETADKPWGRTDSTDTQQIIATITENSVAKSEVDGLSFQHSVIIQEKDYLDKIAALNEENKCLSDERKCLSRAYAETVNCIHEILITFHNLRLSKEKEMSDDVKNQKKIMKDRDQAIEDFQNVEKAFSELMVRYEKTKAMLEQMKENETFQKQQIENLSMEIHEQEQKYNLLQTRAKEKITQANDGLLKLSKEKEAESAALKAMIRKAEIKSRSLSATLEQTEKDNKELSRMCEEFAMKHST